VQHASCRQYSPHPEARIIPYDCVIVGGGLSGLYAAWQLEQAGIDYRLLEARARLGGRIDAVTRVQADGGSARYDLGPAWVWPQLQPRMAQLVAALDVPLFGQQVAGAGLYEDATTNGPLRLDTPSPHGESLRIAHGALSLIEALADRLEAGHVQRDCRVTGLADRGGRVELRLSCGGEDHHMTARQVILAMPPRLVVRGLAFEPVLPQALQDRLRDTPTWMAAHAKFLAFYARPFWREQGLSGEVFSRIGPLTEIYDASPVEGGPYALFGFYGLPAVTRREIGTKTLAAHTLAQLARLFGPRAQDVLDWRIRDWSEDPLTATADDRVPPAGHPAYGLPEAQRVIWDGKLIFSGTETAAENGGYLEGALEAAEAAVSDVLVRLR
jgi:monoamine oxidase